MVDFPDYSLDELKKILSNLRGESAIEAQRDAVGQAEELARQAKQAQQPIGQIGDVLDKEAAQSAVQSPAEAARKAAQAKLDAAAKGSVGEGVIANTPPTRQFDALEKLKTAAKGTVGDNVITSVPTSPGLERMASAEELASVGYKAPTAIESPVASVASGESRPVGQILKNLGQKFSNLTYDDVLNTLKSGGSKIKNIPQATKAALPEFANAAKIGANMLGEGAFNVAKDTAKLIPEAASAIDAGISTAGQAGLKGLRVAGSTPVAAGMAFLDPTETHVGPGEDSVESTAKRMRERLTPEEQAKVDQFSKLLQAQKQAGMLPYQQQSQAEQGDNSSLFDRVSKKYQEMNQAQGLEQQSVPGPLSLGHASKSPAPKKEDREPASDSENEQQGPSIMDQYNQAQQAANEGTLAGQLGKAGALVGSGIVGTGGITKPTETHDKLFDTNIAIAQQIPEQFKQKMEMSRLDPASDVSKAARGFIQDSLGVDVPDNISAQQLKEQFPVIEKLLQARENAEMRKAIAEENAKNRQANRDDMKDFREKSLQLREASLGNRAINDIKNDKTVQRTDQRLQALSKAEEIINSKQPLTPQLLSDVEQDMLGAITGSATPATAKLNKIEFKALQRDAAIVLQRLKSGPIDLRTAAPEVVNAVRNSVSLLKKAYENDRAEHINRLVEQKLPLFEGSQDRIADVLKKVASSNKVDKASSKGNVSKSTLQDYAIKHNVTVDKAAQLLKGAGYNVEGY